LQGKSPASSSATFVSTPLSPSAALGFSLSFLPIVIHSLANTNYKTQCVVDKQVGHYAKLFIQEQYYVDFHPNSNTDAFEPSATQYKYVWVANFLTSSAQVQMTGARRTSPHVWHGAAHCFVYLGCVRTSECILGTALLCQAFFSSCQAHVLLSFHSLLKGCVISGVCWSISARTLKEKRAKYFFVCLAEVILAT
jgi:hypothetical protein